MAGTQFESWASIRVIRCSCDLIIRVLAGRSHIIWSGTDWGALSPRDGQVALGLPISVLVCLQPFGCFFYCLSWRRKGTWAERRTSSFIITLYLNGRMLARARTSAPSCSCEILEHDIPVRHHLLKFERVCLRVALLAFTLHVRTHATYDAFA